MKINRYADTISYIKNSFLIKKPPAHHFRLLFRKYYIILKAECISRRVSTCFADIL